MSTHSSRWLAATVSATLLFEVTGVAGAREGTQLPAVQIVRLRFEIPSQPLSTALLEYARQAKTAIVAPAAVVEGRRSRALSGEYTPRAALGQLLDGTGLRPSRSAGGGLTVVADRPAAAAPAAPISDKPPAPAVEDAADTVVVTGYRRVIEGARDLRRNADVIQDSIVAEDIAKFPELNLAESLQRLPGVAIVREAGEGRRINLRGLGSDFTRVKLNGMEVLGNVDSANDSRGQGTRDRAFDFNLFASELFTRVDVEKTLVASEDEGGLAGTVNLHTGRPFDSPGFKLAGSFNGGTNTGTKDFQDRYVGLISNTWGDEFGALASIAYTRRKTEEVGYDTYRWRRATSEDFGPGGPDISKLSQATQDLLRSGEVFFARGSRYSNWEAKQRRLGVTAALQWRPLSNLEFNLDSLYGEFKSDRDEFHIHARGTVAGESALTDDSDYYTRNGVKVPLGPSVINNIQINDRNEAVYLDVSNTNLGTESRVQKTQNRFDQVAFSTKWDATDKLQVTALAGVEQSNYDIPVGDKLYTEAYGGIITDFTRDKYYATNTYDFDTTNPANFRADSFEFRQDYQSSRLSTFKIDLRYELFDTDAVKVGGARRSFKNSGYAYELDALDFDEFQNGTLNDDISKLAYVYRNHDRLSWVAVNVLAAENYYGVDRNIVSQADRLDDWRVEESTTTGYLEYDFNRMLAGHRFRGNVGVRRYKTDQTSIGQINGEPGTAESSYGGWLPSLNVAYDITNDLVARAAYSKNINRVGLDMIRLNASAQVEGGDINVSSGNPALKPYSAHNFDMALDYYFGKVGAVSLSYFFKIINGFPQIAVVNDVPFSATGLPLDSIPGVTLTPTTTVAAYSRPINLDEFHLSGVEINAQSDLVFLPAPFDQLGVVANLTLVNSEVDYATPDQIALGQHYRRPLTGLSHTSGNCTVYYETQRWGARISANHRSEWIDRGSPALRDGKIEDDSDGWLPTTYVDVAAHYSLNDHIRFTFDGINITNQREVQWVNSTHRPHNTLISGSTYFVGVNFRR